MRRVFIFLVVLFTVVNLKNVAAQVQMTARASTIKVNDFLNSIGGNTHMDQRKATSAEVIGMLKYTGIRIFRERANAADAIAVHNATGAKVSLIVGPRDFHSAIPKLHQVAAAGALLAIEGPNEPNNEAVTYNGQTTGRNTTFMPVALFQRDLYATVKGDPELSKFPVFASSTAGGAEPDNVGLQFLTIPSGAGTLMPDGTKYADYANIHNYCKSPSDHANNVVWNSFCTDTTPTYEGVYKSCSNTWNKHFKGYAVDQLPSLPRVTTETGYDWPKSKLTDSQKGILAMHCFLDGYKRGFSYTVFYQMKDVNEGQGLYTADGAPKIAATYIHNFTTILADTSSAFTPKTVNYSISKHPAIVHDMLMQKSNGKFELAVWRESINGEDKVTVKLGKSYGSVKIYDPTIGTEPIQSLRKVKTVELKMTDHPIILEVEK